MRIYIYRYTRKFLKSHGLLMISPIRAGVLHVTHRNVLDLMVPESWPGMFW